MATEEGLTVRLSFSNLFKQFKSTATWLQFPFLAGSGKENAGSIQTGSSTSAPTKPAPEATRWTLLVLDLRAILSTYLHAKFAYLKSIKLCANLLVKNVFSSVHEYSPLAGSTGNGEMGHAPLPRELAFPLPKGTEFSQLYEYIRFPVEMAAGELQGVSGSLSHGRSLQGVRPDSVESDEGSGVGERGREGVGGGRRRRGGEKRDERSGKRSLHLGVSQVEPFGLQLMTTLSPILPFLASPRLHPPKKLQALTSPQEWLMAQP